MDSSDVERIMRLFSGNERGHGYGRRDGAYEDIEKNKKTYKKDSKYIGWMHKKAEFKDYEAHLLGETALGIAPILDDGSVMRVELDIDKIGNRAYEFDYERMMFTFKQSGLPWVVYRTKSGGMRAILFFKEPIDAKLAIAGMKNLSAQLGLSGNEIFPKQAQLAGKDDCPNWTFIPYGPLFDVFAEQCCMKESGNPMTLKESLDWAEGRFITKERFLQVTAAEQRTKTAAGKNGKNHQGNGKFVNEGTIEELIVSVFHDGPNCLWDISKNKCGSYQHNALMSYGTFFKKKYPDNWEEALTWVNNELLRPVGDREKLGAIIKDLRHKTYEYMCKTEPICSHCNPYSCRNQRYGVGNDNGFDGDWAMTIYNREPRIFFINRGDRRIALSADDLSTQHRFNTKCLAYGLPTTSHSFKKDEWLDMVNKNIDESILIDPPRALQTNADELWVIQKFFGATVPNLVRLYGDLFLKFGGGKPGDAVRYRADENRIYGKLDSLWLFCFKSFNMGKKEFHDVKLVIDAKGKFHDRSDGRGWFRSTFSFSLDLFDLVVVENWLSPQDLNQEE